MALGMAMSVCRLVHHFYKLKYLNNYQMDCHDIWYIHSCFQEEAS